MKKLQTNRAIVVEGRYDAVKIAAIVQATIITTDGFAVYSDKSKQLLLKNLAKKDGLILLTDSDGAGFRLRHFIADLVGDENVLQVYTPAVKGKEKRKEIAGKEGLLGVEGIDTELLYRRLEQAVLQDQINASGVAEASENQITREDKRQVTYTDLFRWGFSGSEGNTERKIKFLKALGLPPRISKKELVNVLNKLYTYQELEQKKQELFG